MLVFTVAILAQGTLSGRSVSLPFWARVRIRLGTFFCFYDFLIWIAPLVKGEKTGTESCSQKGHGKYVKPGETYDESADPFSWNWWKMKRIRNSSK